MGQTPNISEAVPAQHSIPARRLEQAGLRIPPAEYGHPTSQAWKPVLERRCVLDALCESSLGPASSSSKSGWTQDLGEHAVSPLLDIQSFNIVSQRCGD